MQTSLLRNIFTGLEGDISTPEAIAEEFSKGFCTSHNIIPDSQLHKDIEKQVLVLAEDIKAMRDSAEYVIIKSSTESAIIRKDAIKEAQQMFAINLDIESLANQLNAALTYDGNKICDKLQVLSETLEKNKTITDSLYDFCKFAKDKEFKKTDDFEGLLSTYKSESNRGDKLNVTSLSTAEKKQLQDITSSFMKAQKTPKDFNEFIDELKKDEVGKSLLDQIVYLIKKIFGKENKKQIVGNFTAKVNQNNDQLTQLSKT